MGTKTKKKHDNNEAIEDKACKLADKLTRKFDVKDATQVAVLLGRVIAGTEAKFDRAVEDNKSQWLPDDIKEMQPDEDGDDDQDERPLRAVK